MLQRQNHLVSRKKNFAFETTLSGLAYLKFIQSAKLKGYDITLFFIWLNNFDLAKKRVAARVDKGGHNIPDAVIERRYKKGIKSFSKYLQVVDDWYIYDNSGPEYSLVAKSIAAQKDIVNFEVYNKLITDE